MHFGPRIYTQHVRVEHDRRQPGGAPPLLIPRRCARLDLNSVNIGIMGFVRRIVHPEFHNLKHQTV